MLLGIGAIDMQKYTMFRIEIIVPDNVDTESSDFEMEIGSFEELLNKFLQNRAVDGLLIFKVSEETLSGDIIQGELIDG